jgi:hypothetical protein
MQPALDLRVLENFAPRPRQIDTTPQLIEPFRERTDQVGLTQRLVVAIVRPRIDKWRVYVEDPGPDELLRPNLARASRASTHCVKIVIRHEALHELTVRPKR